MLHRFDAHLSYGREIILVNTAKAENLFDDIDQRLRGNRGFTIATLNLDHVVKLRQQDSFLTTYLQHSHVVADGNPIVWLRWLAGQPVELLAGSDLIDPLMAQAARLGIPVGFFGSTEPVLKAAAARLTERHPGLNVVACVAPPFGFDPASPDADKAIKALSDAGVRLCLIALGAPKQEVLAIRAHAAMPNCGFISIGAGLDFIAGHQVRAPSWMRRVALEWLWRFLGAPSRLGWRYLACIGVLPSLIWQALAMRRT